jgi:hypothetical protein
MTTKYEGPFAALSANAGWTHFYDMHSGGPKKLQWQHIFIQAPQEEAEIIFQNRFGRDPRNVTCECCGSDYSIHFEKTLEEMKKYWNKEGRETERIIFAAEIKDYERHN